MRLQKGRTQRLVLSEGGTTVFVAKLMSTTEGTEISIESVGAWKPKAAVASLLVVSGALLDEPLKSEVHDVYELVVNSVADDEIEDEDMGVDPVDWSWRKWPF